MHTKRFHKVEGELENCNLLTKYKCLLSMFIDSRVPRSTLRSMCLPQALCYFLKRNTKHCFCFSIRWSLSMFIDFMVPPNTPWSMCLPQALFLPEKMYPCFFGACILWMLSFVIRFRVSGLVFGVSGLATEQNIKDLTYLI